MKPDPYFRHAGRPPCTPNVTVNNGSKERHESSSSATGAKPAPSYLGFSDQSTHGGDTSDGGNSLSTAKEPKSCTYENTGGNASGSLHASSGEHSGGTSRTMAGSCESLTDSRTTLRCADGSPNWKDITKEPNACTADATDASGSAEPLTSSDSATGDGSHTTAISSPHPKHGETTSHGAASMPHRRRGRPRKSP